MRLCVCREEQRGKGMEDFRYGAGSFLEFNTIPIKVKTK